MAQLLQHKFIYQVPRFVQPSRRDPPQTTLNLVAIEDPPHGAWPTCSTYVAIGKNINAYLKTDDYALGSTLNFVNKFPIAPLLPINSIDSTSGGSHARQQNLFALSHIQRLYHHFPGNSAQYNPQILRNLKLTQIAFHALHLEPHVQELSPVTNQVDQDPIPAVSNETDVFVCLADVVPNTVVSAPSLQENEDDHPKKTRPLAKKDEKIASKQQRIGQAKSVHEAYNLAPQSTHSGNVKGFQQAKNE